MRHFLMDPRFPDIVGEWAARQADGSANDNARSVEDEDEFAELFLLEIARRDIEANRLW